MTICIAIACDCETKKPKVIMVADRMITMRGLDVEFEHPKTKLTRLTNNCVVATAGNSLAITELFDAVRQKLKITKHTPQIRDIASMLKDTYVELRRKEIEDSILKPIGIDSFNSYYKSQQDLTPGIAIQLLKKIKKYDYRVFLSIGGVDNSGAHIYAVDDPGVMYNLDEMGYDAIGSGDTHALLAVIAANYHSGTPFEEALYLAYKAKKMSEKAPGIGTKYTDIWVVESDAIYEIQQGDKEMEEGKKVGIKILEEMYDTEIKSKIPFDQLAKIAKTPIKSDPEVDKSYS